MCALYWKIISFSAHQKYGPSSWIFSYKVNNLNKSSRHQLQGFHFCSHLRLWTELKHLCDFNAIHSINRWENIFAMNVDRWPESLHCSSFLSQYCCNRIMMMLFSINFHSSSVWFGGGSWKNWQAVVHYLTDCQSFHFNIHLSKFTIVFLLHVIQCIANGREKRKGRIKSRLERNEEKAKHIRPKKNEFDSFSGHLLFFMHLEMFANLSGKWIGKINK